MTELTEIRFGHGRLINPHEVEKRLQARTTQYAPELLIFQSEPAILKDYQQIFNKASKSRPGTGAGNVQFNPGSIVEGVVIYTTPVGGQILDEEEYVHLGHYQLTPATVELRDQTKKEVTIYTARPKVTLDESHPAFGNPHPEYLLAILRGGKEFHVFSPEYWNNIASIADKKSYREYIIEISHKNNDPQILNDLDNLITYINEVRGNNMNMKY